MLHPLPKNVYSLCLVSTLAITTHPPRCCEDRARLVADKLANGKEPKDARRGCPSRSRSRSRTPAASERRRPHATSARARVAVPALAAGLLLVPHEDAYQCVRTCPGARGWGEAWAAGAEPSSCAEMAPQAVVVCSTCQPRPAAGDGWTMSISGDKELPHLVRTC